MHLTSKLTKLKDCKINNEIENPNLPDSTKVAGCILAYQSPMQACIRLWFHWPIDLFSLTSPSLYGKATGYFAKVQWNLGIRDTQGTVKYRLEF